MGRNIDYHRNYQKNKKKIDYSINILVKIFIPIEFTIIFFYHILMYE
jgi:hypothetical protein